MAFHILICTRWQSSLWSTAVVWPMSGHVFPQRPMLRCSCISSSAPQRWAFEAEAYLAENTMWLARQFWVEN